MPTLTAEYLDDLARVKLEASDLDPEVVYSIERSIDGGTSWVTVRGATNITDGGVTVVYDYEYAPNIENLYRITAPVISDTFERTVNPAGLVVDGAAGSFADTPNAALPVITGDIDIQVEVWRDDWSAPATEEVMAARYDDSSDNRSWRFTYDSSGFLRFQWSSDGTTGTTESESSSVSPVDVLGSTGPAAIALRVTRDSSTGNVTFYHSTSFQDSASDWETLGNVQSGTTGAMFAGTADLEAGSRDNGSQTVWNGRIIGMHIADAIDGGADIDVNFAKQPTGTGSFVDDTGFTWTVHGTATIAGNDQAWGSTDTGQLWNEYVDPAHFPEARWWVETGAGRLHNPKSSFSGYGRYIDVDLTDFEARYDLFMPDIAPVANDDAEFYLLMRGTDDLSDGYSIQLFIESSTKEARLRIGTDPGATEYVDVGSWQVGQRWRVRARVVGTIIEARAWNTANPEPNTWHVVATSTNRASGTVGIMNFGLTNDEVNAVFDNVLVTQIPPVGAAVVAVTPIQDDVWLKSIAFPSLNQNLGCIQTTARTRRSRVGLFDIKGRHEVLGIADVGSTEAFTILFDTHSVEENTAITGLLTFGAPLLLQSPPDADETGCGNIAAYPSGWFMPGDSTQVRPLLGKRVWEWQVPLTRVAAPAPQSILPAHMTWNVLWQMVNTWVEVWDEWATWAELWNASVAPSAMFNALSGGGSP